MPDNNGSNDENNRNYKKILIKNILDIDLSSSSDKKETDKKDTEKKEIEDMTDDEIDDMTQEDITDLVLNNPTFKAAFLSKPGFWRRLVGGKDMGILAAKKILKNFNDGDSKANGEGKNEWRENQTYFLQLMDKSFNMGDVSLEMTPTRYKVKAKKRTNVDGTKTVFLEGNGFKFQINKKTDSKNQYRATLVIGANTDNEYSENRTIKVTDN